MAKAPAVKASGALVPDDLVGFTVKELFLEIRHDVRAVADTVNEILQKGSQHAREALKQTAELDSRVSILERDAASKDAVEKNAKNTGTLAISVGVTLLVAIVDGLTHFFK